MDSILGEEEDLNERTFNMIPTKEHWAVNWYKINILC